MLSVCGCDFCGVQSGLSCSVHLSTSGGEGRSTLWSGVSQPYLESPTTGWRGNISWVRGNRPLLTSSLTSPQHRALPRDGHPAAHAIAAATGEHLSRIQDHPSGSPASTSPQATRIRLSQYISAWHRKFPQPRSEDTQGHHQGAFARRRSGAQTIASCLKPHLQKPQEDEAMVETSGPGTTKSREPKHFWRGGATVRRPM